MPSRRAFGAPLALTFGLLLLSFAPRVHDNPLLSRSFWGATLALLLWQVALFVSVQRAGMGRSLQPAMRPQHYLQALIQVAVFAYWGYYWRPVYDHVWLLVAQIVFAYTFDMLLAWSRRDRYVIGFGPFPIIFSTNLFLWFRDDWFYLQFLMIAVGFLGKEFVRWQRDGKRVHIFNPSAFSLGLFSLVLIGTNTTDLTWGYEIATTLTLAPSIYLFLFLLGLVVMYFFSITLVSGSAAITLFGLSALYSAWAGVPYFIDSEIPAAVFLGLFLLVTDPSTSPRTPLGKTLFGALYGFGVFGLYTLLGALGAPTFYDKLLCVPLLNLAVPRIDSLARFLEGIPLVRRWGEWAPAPSNLVHMAVWTGFFALMTAIGSTDGMHRGDALPFWEQACAEGRRNACDRLLQIESSYCGDNSAWACNELGGHYREGVIVTPDAELAWSLFSRACELRYRPGCFNLLDAGRSGGDAFSRTDPRVLDLRLLLREAGPNLLDLPLPDLYGRACDHGWTFACPEPGASADTPAEETQGGPSPANPAPLPGVRTDARFSPADDALGFVQIPAGTFVMGSDAAIDPLGFDNERWSAAESQGQVHLPTYFIGRYEVTVAQFRAFTEATGYQAVAAALRGPPDHPVTSVSWPDALAYSRWLETTLRDGQQTPPELRALLRDGWRIGLPSEAEWEKAARGTDGRIYPWGNAPRADRANYGGATTTPVGTFDCPECPFGLFDMGGNVWELTRSPYQAYPFDPTDDRDDLEEDALWVMRGGHFGDPERYVRTTVRGGIDPGARRPFIGFRLVLSRF